MNIRLIIAVLFISMSFHAVQAQQADRVQRGQRGYTPPSNQVQTTYIELYDPHYEVSVIVPKCEKEFSLDAFQSEILKSMLLKKFEDENEILSDKANSREERKKKLIERNNMFFKDLESIMTKEQIEKFKLMDFSETKEEKKERKKKKRKKKKNKDNKS